MKSLDQLRQGEQAYILCIEQPAGSDYHEDLQKRLLEMGFETGVHVCVRHESPFGKDVIAVELDGAVTIAIRKHDAVAILCESYEP